MAISPARYNIRPQRRADYPMPLVFEDASGVPMDLTGYTVLAQVWSNDRTLKYGDFVVTTTNFATGRADLLLPRTVTEILPDECRYDVMLISPNGLREYYVEGIVRPSQGYTA